jgi:UDP-3-O-acyl-N-acetylglucosamine deacetylase
MKKLRLNESVTVKGYDLFGRKSSITFRPSEQPGWWWDNNGKVIPIDRKIVKLKKNQLILEKNGQKLHTIEHILVLRWLGLDGVIIQSDSWPPYHGRPQEIWDSLKPKTSPVAEEVKWGQHLCFKHVHHDDNRTVQFCPGLSKGLSLKIICDFPKFGRREKWFMISQEGDPILEKCLGARALACNSRSIIIQSISGFLYHLGLWRHHHCLAWPNIRQESLLDELVSHRLIDLLGALAMLNKNWLPAGIIISHKGGHALDLELIKMMA